MNAFEIIVAQYLEEKGYWVRKSVKIDLPMEDKLKIGKKTRPRPEIDLIALNFEKNELLLVEVKSFLDSSSGVVFEAVIGKKHRDNTRYKLFNEPNYRKIVKKNLRKEYLRKGLINQHTKINYGLAAGNIRPTHKRKLKDYFSKKGWILFTPNEIKEKIKELSNTSWEDDLVTMTAKLVLRE